MYVYWDGDLIYYIAFGFCRLFILGCFLGRLGRCIW
nr:MAG TPA: hypothetical protein [Caudoviricetes sp.]